MPIRITGLNSGLDTESIISALVSSYNYKTQKYEKAQTKLSWKQDAWKSLNTKIYSLYNSIGNLRFSSAYSMKSASVSNSTKMSVTAGSGAVNGTYSVQVESLAKSAYLTGGELKKDGSLATANTTLKELGFGNGTETAQIKLGENGKEITVSSSDTVADVINTLKGAGVNASFDAKNGRIFVSAKKTGAAGDFTLTGVGDDGNTALEALGLSTTSSVESKKATKVDGTDAVIYVNDAKFTSESNTFNINGLTINATGLTGDYDKNNPEAVSVTVSTDVQGIYDKVKEFISQYNAIMNEMSALYNADSAKGYEPLTDEEKDAMSDTEVEKWEEKIKSSLLRRDDTLSGIISAMSSVMTKAINVDADGDGKGDGKNYYLADFGIKTLSYFDAPKNERYAYHIDGDADDANTSGNTDRLMAAISEDPDAVIGFMKQLSTDLYNTIGNRMKSTTLSSSYTIYNDKEMASEYSDYTSLITKWQERLERQEEFYYQKFAAMESALAKLNSQTSSLSGFFG